MPKDVGSGADRPESTLKLTARAFPMGRTAMSVGGKGRGDSVRALSQEMEQSYEESADALRRVRERIDAVEKVIDRAETARRIDDIWSRVR